MIRFTNAAGRAMFLSLTGEHDNRDRWNADEASLADLAAALVVLTPDQRRELTMLCVGHLRMGALLTGWSFDEEMAQEIEKLNGQLERFRHLGSVVLAREGGATELHDHEDRPTGDFMCASCGESAESASALVHDDDCLRSLAEAAFDADRPPTRPVVLKHPEGDWSNDDVDPRDSESLRRLRNLIDDKLGWRDVEQQEGGDYEARIVEIGEALKAWREAAIVSNEHPLAVLQTAVFP